MLFTTLFSFNFQRCSSVSCHLECIATIKLLCHKCEQKMKRVLLLSFVMNSLTLGYRKLSRLTSMFEVGKKSVYLKKTHASKGKTYNIHTDVSVVGLIPRVCLHVANCQIPATDLHLFCCRFGSSFVCGLAPWVLICV